MDENGVFALVTDLNDCVAVGAVHLLDEARIHAAFVHGVKKQLSVKADASCVIHLGARLGNGDGLIKSLAAGKDVAVIAMLGLAHRYDVVKLIYVVYIARTEIHDLQSRSSFGIGIK